MNTPAAAPRGFAPGAGGRPVLYPGVTIAAAVLEPLVAEGQIDCRPPPRSLDDLATPPGCPIVLLLDEPLARGRGTADALLRLPDSVVVVATAGAAELLDGAAERIHLELPDGARSGAAVRNLRLAFRHAAARVAAARVQEELSRARGELRELNRIGMALMTERDPERLLVQILQGARQLTHSDAGSIYLVEQAPDGTRQMRFSLAQNDSLPDLPLIRFTLPVNTSSVAGYAAVTGEALVLDDAYHLPDDAPYSFNRSFDERFGYRTRSQLVVPMIDHQGLVVGVLQLINRRSEPDAGAPEPPPTPDNAAVAKSSAPRRAPRTPHVPITSEAVADAHVLPYGEREVELARSLAGQAAVSIENAHLYRQIEGLFDSFVKAAVTAIDQRDPTTSGHSVRVAALTCDMAEALARWGGGPYAGLRFTREQMRELRYAALLHDFGKVGVREEVLVKAKKLPPYLLERVETRFALIRRTLEAEYFRERAERLQHAARAGGDADVGLLEHTFRERLAELERFHHAVRAANEPTVLPERAADVLDQVAARTFTGADGEHQRYLSDEELQFLVIPKGTLDERERREIESHVEQTYRFLTQIPWTDDLRNVAHIAYGHHEKLNGRGYPRGVRGEQIPLQTRMMTIADIFDALTASDRPYKRALPSERALDILVMEADQGLLDRPLVNLLIQGELYRKVLEQDWREL